MRDLLIAQHIRPRYDSSPDFDLIRDLMLETGVLDRSVEFADSVDTWFGEGAKTQTAWHYEPGDLEAH